MKHIIKKRYHIYKTDEYQFWFDAQTMKAQFQIDERMEKIKNDGYFGTHKFLIDEIWELKWLNGRRIYYAYIEELEIVVLLGGNKNGQTKDVNQANKIYKKYQKTNDR